MPASAATAYPVQDQAYRVSFVIKNLTTGNPLTGGLTGLASQVSQDGANFVNSSNSPVEINPSSGTGSGYGYLDLLASEMNYSTIIVRITATNASAIEWQQVLLTDGVAQVQSGIATSSALSSALSTITTAISSAVSSIEAAITAAETAILAAMPTVTTIWNQADYGDSAGRATTIAGQIAQIWRYLFNSQTVDKNAQTQTLYRDNSTTPLVQGPIAVNSQQTNKGKMQ